MSYTKENILLDVVIEQLGLKNDAALARLLEVSPPVVSKIRSSVTPISPWLVIRIHEVSRMSVREIKAALGQECLPRGGKK